MSRAELTPRFWIGLLAALLIQAGVIVWLVRTIRRRRRLEQERDTLLSTLQSRNQELARLGEVMAHHFQEPARRLVRLATGQPRRRRPAGHDRRAHDQGRYGLAAHGL